MIKNVLIKDIVKKENIAIDKDLSISDAIELMYKNKEGTVIVLDKNIVVGILTERDLIQLLNSKTNLSQKVINVTKKDIISINTDRTLEYALNVLIDHHIRRLVIVDNNKEFAGLVTQEMIISNFESEYFRENLKVWQIVSSLSKEIITIEIDRSLEDVVESMYTNSIGSILVSNNKKIVGIITERDLVYLTSKKTAPSTPVEEVMSSPVVSVELNESVQSIVNMMVSNNIRRVLVKDQAGNNLCVMGTRDIVNSLKGTFGLFIETKLKYTKQALNSIDEVIFELYRDSKVGLLIQWGNESALNRYGTDIIDKPMTTLIAKEKSNLLLGKLDVLDQIDDYNLDIGKYSYKVSINTGDNLDSFLMICKDMTKIIALKNEVKEQQMIFENIFQKSSDGILLIEDKKIIDCNESVLKMFEYSKSELLNLDVSSLCLKYDLHSELTSEKADELIGLILTDTYHSFECIKSTKNGKNLWIDVVGTKIVQNGKDIIHVVLRDISQRKKAEYALEQLSKHLQHRVDEEVEKNRKQDQQILEQSRLAQIGEMISMIAHQWRQPLASISALSMAIKIKIERNKLDKDKMIELTDDIAAYSQDLSSIIDDFREFFKPDSEQKDTTYNTLIDDVLNIVETSIVSKNIQLIKKLNCTNTLHTYPNKLKQVILSLIKNAEDILVERDIDNPTITIETSNGILTIADNGGGIEEDILGKIFDPYFSTKTEKNGSGLGLYMSKTVIEKHCGGKLSVENRDGGALFSIKLNRKI